MAMPIVSAALLNRPCWFDLSTSDLEAAKSLYGELFGWSFMDSGEEMGHYTMAFAPGGHAAAALAPKMPGQEQIPSMWTVYFGVADADATAAAIGAHGGSITVPTMDIPGSGRMAIVADPEGATFGLWQAAEFAGAGIEGEHGAMCWSEVNSTNAEANAGFYAAVFGLTAHKIESAGAGYFTLHDGEPPIFGVLQMDEHWAGIAPHWMAYFMVADLEAANAVWQKHGGTLLHGPIPSPHGRIMVAQDPQGAVISYISAP